MKRRSRLIRSVTNRRQWLIPGLGVKRWLVLLVIGSILAGTGFAAIFLIIGQRNLLPSWIYFYLTLQFLPTGLRVSVPLLLGGLLVFIAIYQLGKSLVAPFRRPTTDVVQSLYDYKQKRRGPRIVAIGGGTGMPNLLRGLRAYTSNITAIVTVADDGGSSGRIRRELGLLPPGDFRNNIAALAKDELLMTQLMQYRFRGRTGGPEDREASSELTGHAFGNLLLAALAGVTGSFDKALVAAGRVLAVQGHVFPSTLWPVNLSAMVRLPGSTESFEIVGESTITNAGGEVESVSLIPESAPAYPQAVQAILEADLVVIGPGSLYTSILPNLLVRDIAKALVSTKATRIYVCNLATQPGETDNYSVANHVGAIRKHMKEGDPNNLGFLDIVLANDNLSIPSTTGGGNTVFVLPDTVAGIRQVTADLVDEMRPWRHDSSKLAITIMDIA